MYSGENKGHERFVRHEANGQDFEFSDGRFVVNARMEGSTYKPILHLSISPMNQDELGNVMYIKVSRHGKFLLYYPHDIDISNNQTFSHSSS